MSKETISEEQELHNKLSFDINVELIHLMKRIVELQEANKFLEEALTKSESVLESICMNTLEENAKDFRKCLDYLENYKNRVDKAIKILKNTNVDIPSTILIETIDYAIYELEKGDSNE